MPLMPIPVGLPPYKNVEEMGIKQYGAELLNGYIDEQGNLNKRPGYKEFVDLASGSFLQGLYYWRQKDKLVAVSNGKIYLIGKYQTIQDITKDTLNINNRVIFDSDKDILYMCNGEKVVFYSEALDPNSPDLWPSAGIQGDQNFARILGDTYQMKTTYYPGPDALENVNYLTLYTNWFLMQKKDSDSFWHSDLGMTLKVDALSFFTADMRIDENIALYTLGDEITIFGRETIEYWQNDGINPFSRITGVNLDKGILSPHILARLNNTFYALDTDRRLVEIQGRNTKVLSIAYDKELQKVTDIGNAFSMNIVWNGKAFFAIVFPADQKCFVYDYMLNTFQGEWNYFDAISGNYTQYEANNYVYIPEWGKHLIGSRQPNSKIYEIDGNTYQDNGNNIKTVYRTPYINRQTDTRKRCKRLTFRVKRGQQTKQTTKPAFEVRWRDDGGVWQTPVIVDLGDIGEYETFKNIYNLGIYRSRQWEITHTDNSPFILAGIEEDFDYLEIKNDSI